jgi:hypothetical protein
MQELRQVVVDLRAEVAAKRGAAEVLELTAIKGRQFEELAFEAIANIASLLGDQAESVGDHLGNAANKSGDVVVALSTDATPGAAGRIVLEIKDKKLSMRETHAELERAMKNRDAQAGVIVFSREEHAPTALPLQMFGSKIVVVLDKDELDERALRLAIAAARCVVQRQTNSTVSGANDIEAALALVEEGQRALALRSTAKRCLTQAQRQLVGAGDGIDQLVDKLDEVLRHIADKLGR